MKRAAVGVDVGGTKLAAGVVLEDGTLLAREQAVTPATLDAEALFEALRRLCQGVVEAARSAAEAAGAEGAGVEAAGTEAARREAAGAEVAGVEVAVIGVGCGGPMRYPQGEVSPLNIPAWRGFPLRTRLGAAFGLPCVVDNDAKAMALGEHWLGAGRGSRNMIGMVVSTGVGGGLILDGRLVHGERGNAGHIGHLIVQPGGPRCGCGACGCAEAIASGTGIARRLAAAVADGETTALPAGASAAQVAELARAGDALAQRLFREAGQAVGRGIASAAALLDVELAVVGGSIALRAWDLLGPPLEAELRRCTRLDFTREVQVVQAALGEAAGVIGAARLGLEALAEDDDRVL